MFLRFAFYGLLTLMLLYGAEGTGLVPYKHYLPNLPRPADSDTHAQSPPSLQNAALWGLNQLKNWSHTTPQSSHAQRSQPPLSEQLAAHRASQGKS